MVARGKAVVRRLVARLTWPYDAIKIPVTATQRGGLASSEVL